MSEHHDETVHSSSVSEKIGGIEKFLRFAAGEVLAEIVGHAGYDKAKSYLKKYFGTGESQPSHDHHEDHPTAPASSIHVDPEGRGLADEQAFMQELAGLNGRAGVAAAEYEAAVKWFGTKSKKFRENFRNGYFKEEDQTKRLRFLARFCKLDDNGKNALTKAAGHEEPVNHAAHEFHKFVHLLEEELPGINKDLAKNAQALKQNGLVRWHKKWGMR